MSSFLELFRRNAMTFMAGDIAAKLYLEAGGNVHSLKKTAFHEAGHAFFHWHFGLPIYRAIVRSDGSGVVLTRPEPTSKISHSDAEEIKSASDMYQIIFEDAPDLRAIEQETEHLLKTHWNYVTRIAERLYMENPREVPEPWEASISGSEIRLICEFSMKPKGENNVIQKTG
jgi:hypothetical protein